MTPEQAAVLTSFCFSILFLGLAVSTLIDEIKDYLLDKIKEKRERVMENADSTDR